jgi:DNA (cytosine-5)-methyltransferase 1
MRAVDLFAGWGGFTSGATAAGVQVVWAANHLQVAVDVHSANHPGTRHECQDLRQADWTALPRYELLLASPACQGHSTAGRANRERWGSAKKHESDRATAWAVVDCADATEPAMLIVENVPSFREWRLYGVWRAGLEALGYHLQEHVVVASKHSETPQRRERLVIVGSKRAIAPIQLRERPEAAFGPCVDWNEGAWRPIAEARDSVRARFEKAADQLGRRGIVQHVTRGGRVRLDEPIRTITTKDQWCVFKGGREGVYRGLTPREYARGMGFPEDYAWPATLGRDVVVRGLGNAVPPPLAREVVSAVLEAA